jgi:SAM-dependent methyltransferase
MFDDHPVAPVTAAQWDERYLSTSQLFSGRPNFALVTETSGLSPGRALDVGCGEGADAVWLAVQGWDVTALDVSQVALKRAARLAQQAQVQVQWIPAALLDAPLPAHGFDLVCMHYPALPRAGDGRAEAALLDAVAAEGALLAVYHAGFDGELAARHGIVPADYVQPADLVSALLRGDWRIALDTRRARELPPDVPDRGHVHDVVLRARRLS